VGTKAGAMAHRHSVASRNVAVIVLCVFTAFLIFMGLVYVSNQVNRLRSDISGLQDHQEFLEAHGAALLAQWNAATRSETISKRAQLELGLQLQDSPSFVLVRKPENNQNSSWHNLLNGFSQNSANAAEVPGNQNATQIEMQESP